MLPLNAAILMSMEVFGAQIVWRFRHCRASEAHIKFVHRDRRDWRLLLDKCWVLEVCGKGGVGTRVIRSSELSVRLSLDPMNCAYNLHDTTSKNDRSPRTPAVLQSSCN